MPRVGPYGIPFPYDPYPLQEHAMTALRCFLEETSAATPTRKHHHKTALTSVPDKSPIKEKQEVEDGSSNRRTSVASPSSSPSQPNTATTVAVLESPTGTGKSHMLLNSVLSHLFTPIDNNGNSSHSTAERADATLQHNLDPSPPPAQQQQTTATTTTSQAPTLESVLKQRQMEEEVDRIRHERKARVRARRRQLRRARKLMQLQQRQQQQQQLSSSSMAHAEGNDDFLISQDPLLWLKEHEPTCPLYSSSDSSSSFSSSSSSSSSQHSGADCGSDDNNEEDDAESAIEGSLATLLPLRKPKVYIASRTHTQLEQLMRDLKQTAFSTHPLRARQQHQQASLPVELNESTAAAATPAGPGTSSSPRRLTAVHVAGRQHLCINRRILQKSGGGEMLNHYCREAMQYERSAEGRKARRRRQQRAQQAGISPLAFTDNSIAAAMENGAPSLLSHQARGREMADMEDWGAGRSMGSTTPTLGGRAVGASAKATHDAHSKFKNDREADDGDGRTGGEEEDRGCAYCAESHLRALLDFLRAEQREQQRSDATTPPSLGKKQKTASASIYTMDRLRHLGQALRACPYIATRLLLRSADVAFIPYSYLLDEGQRSVLLGGVTTNPATAAEAAAAGMSDMLDEGEMEHSSASAYKSKGNDDDDGDEHQAWGEGITKGENSTAKFYGQVGGVSLGTVLYHRRQRVTAAAAFRRKRQQQQQQQWSNKKSPRGRGGDGDAYVVGNSPFEHSTEVTSQRKGRMMAKNGEKNNEEDDDDDVWGVAARAAPPSFRHDILVFDEAHNIADHCRAISTVSLLLWQLRLVEHLFQHYLARYESRLLTRNKQRLRELIRFLGKLIRFCERQPPPSTATSSVWPFHTFLFEAGIDSVDVYALLLFLVDTQLLMKLQGFMGYCLDTEQRELEKRSATDAANGSAGTVKRQRTLLFADARGGKRVRTASSGARDVLREQRQQQRQFLASLDAADDVTEEHRTVPEKVMAADTASCAGGVDGGTPPLSLSSLLRQHATPHGTCMDAARQRAIAAECLQRLERLLCMLHVSDAVSTRVLWTPGEAGKTDKGSGSSSSGGGGDTADVDGCVLRLIQLEPGQHTFASLVREAKAVVLAGGTMQPLALTCGPLLPLAALAAGDVKGSGSRATCPRDEEGRGGRDSHDGAASQPPSPALPVRLISEGHVVPPSSVRVFTLATGPSHVRMEFTQQQLMGLSTTTTTTTTASASRSGSGATAALPTVGSPLARMMSELGCTLLNFARVLPPAGVICFFTSYDAMERIVAALQSCGYFQQINEIKRIFQETRGGAGGKMTRTKKDKAWTSAREHDLSMAARAVKETSDSLPGGSGFDEEREESFAKGESGHAGDVLQAYQDWINGAVTPATTSSSSSTSTQPAMRRGAMLFAVMGGRLSEGINFADDLGRAVIVIGMPYANPTDVELQLNLRHIATTRLGVEETDGEHRSTGNMTSSGSSFSHAADDRQSNAASLSSALASSSTSSTPFASAAEWGLYMDGMMRTVNQCIGRCIRHKDDYAVIILLDARYGERADVRRRVSAWLHPSLRVTKLFGECFAGVREFFAERKTVTESK